MFGKGGTFLWLSENNFTHQITYSTFIKWPWYVISESLCLCRRASTSKNPLSQTSCVAMQNPSRDSNQRPQPPARRGRSRCRSRVQRRMEGWRSWWTLISSFTSFQSNTYCRAPSPDDKSVIKSSYFFKAYCVFFSDLLKMGKHAVGSPKWISNRIKSKGLQKLRW